MSGVTWYRHKQVDNMKLFLIKYPAIKDRSKLSFKTPVSINSNIKISIQIATLRTPISIQIATLRTPILAISLNHITQVLA